MFVGLGLLFRVWQLDWLAVHTAQSTIQSGDGSGVSTLAQLDPKHHQTGMRVSAAHIFDERDFFFSVLIGVAVRPVRTICQRLKSTVVLFAPAVDVLPGGLIADGSLCYAVTKRIFNYYLLIPHVLCYLTHSE